MNSSIFKITRPTEVHAARSALSPALAFAVGTVAVGLVAVIAGRNDPPGIVGLAMLNGVFVLLFLGSAGLFNMAAGRDAVADAA